MLLKHKVLTYFIQSYSLRLFKYTSGDREKGDFLFTHDNIVSSLISGSRDLSSAPRSVHRAQISFLDYFNPFCLSTSTDQHRGELKKVHFMKILAVSHKDCLSICSSWYCVTLALFYKI